MNYLKKDRTYGLNWWEVIRWIIVAYIAGIVIQGVSRSRSFNLEQLTLLFLVLTALILLVVRLYLEKNPREIKIYGYGIVTVNGKETKTFRWNELSKLEGTRYSHSYNGFPMLRYGANRFYVGETLAFSVSYFTEKSDQLVNFILSKMHEAKIPVIMNSVQRGETLDADTVRLSQIGIGNKKDWILWGEISSLRYKSNKLYVTRFGQSKEVALGPFDTMTGYIFLGIIDQLRGTQMFAILQREAITGQMVLGNPKRIIILFILLIVVLAVALIVVPPLMR
jgi:hypothetical protein